MATDRTHKPCLRPQNYKSCISRAVKSSKIHHKGAEVGEPAACEWLRNGCDWSKTGENEIAPKIWRGVSNGVGQRSAGMETQRRRKAITF